MEEVKGVIRLTKGFVADASEKMPRVAERAGDRVIVRLWITSKRRLIHRSITLYPDGHHDREDTVIAEDLPIR